MKKIYITVLAGVCALTVFAQTATTDPGVVINGVTWATRNVDMPGTFAATPESAGMFYQWNKNVGWSSTDPLENSNGGTTWDNTMPTGNSWAVENDPCPAGWRVPTVFELQVMAGNHTSWDTQNGVEGHFFGSGNNVIFLPAAGYLDTNNGTRGGNGGYWGRNGRYWSATLNGNYAYLLSLGETSTAIYSNEGSLPYPGQILFGYCIRCVKAASSAVENTKTDELQIIIENGELKIENYEGETVQIFDIAGRAVGARLIAPLQNGTETINISHLQSGIYIVKIGEKTAKFVKK